MNPFAPLSDRDFRRYFAGEVLSPAGSRPTLCDSCWWGTMAALAYAGSPSLPALYVLTFVIGLVEIVWQADSLTGAALGGPILVRFGLGTAFAIDAGPGLALLAAVAPAVRRAPLRDARPGPAIP